MFFVVFGGRCVWRCNAANAIILMGSCAVKSDHFPHIGYERVQFHEWSRLLGCARWSRHLAKQISRLGRAAPVYYSMTVPHG